MRVMTGRTWVDYGPASSAHGLTGHHSSLSIGLEARSPTGMPQSTAVSGHCGVCVEPTTRGRMYCSAEHARMGYGNRRA